MLGFAALLIGNLAIAGDNFKVGVKAGTLGIGAEVSWQPIAWLDIRAGANYFDYQDEGSQAGINYDATLSLDTYYATLNFLFPLSPFRLTAGAYQNANEVLLVSQEQGTVVLGDNNIAYSADDAGTLRSTTTFDEISPYIGAGFDFNVMDRLGISLDFGVLWQGQPIVTLQADGQMAQDPIFQTDLENERIQLEAAVETMKIYPVISIGFSFIF